MSQATQALAGQALLGRLHDVDGITAIGPRGQILEARLVTAVSDVQCILEDSGYYLEDWAMDEGHTYRLNYRPSEGLYGRSLPFPLWIDIRMYTDGFSLPPIALAYYNDSGTLVRYDHPNSVVRASNTPEAKKNLASFGNSFPNKTARWIPVFNCHWPAVTLKS